MGLRSKMHDCVDLALTHYEKDKIGGQNIALHGIETRQPEIRAQKNMMMKSLKDERQNRGHEKIGQPDSSIVGQGGEEAQLILQLIFVAFGPSW